MAFVRTQANDLAIDLFGNLIDHLRLTFREIERSLTNFAIVENAVAGRLGNDDYELLVFLSIIRATKPDLYLKIKQGKINFGGVDGLYAEADLEGLKPEEWAKQQFDVPNGLTLLLKYDLSSDEEAEAIRGKNPRGFLGRTGKMIRLCSYWDKFKT